MRRSALALAGIALLASTLLVPAPAHAGDEDACGWPMYGRDLGHSFASPTGCTSLSPLTAPSIAPRWGLLTSDSLTAAPTVVDGVAYAGDWTGAFYAVPVSQGGVEAKATWTFHVPDPSHVAFGRIVSSASVASVDGTRVVIFGGGATLYVLDAADGHELAHLCLDPRADPAVRCNKAPSGTQVEVESSPAVVTKGAAAQIVVGIDVHNRPDVGRTGVVSSLLRHRRSGWSLEPTWKLDPEGDDGRGATYRGPDLLTTGSGTGAGCASVWGSPAVDVPDGLVFFGTGSCGADGVEVGEDAYAADLRTGELVWRYDTPRVDEDWDDDYGASPNLLPGGLVGFGSKDGSYYALDRLTGGLAWIAHVGQSGHVTDGFAVGGIIGTPAVGTVAGRAAVFATTALSTPIAEPLDEGDPAAWPDTTLAEDPGRLLSLSAIDAATGRVLWRTPLARQSYGAPTYADGVVLVPSTFSAELLAFHADTGALLSAMPVVGAPSSSPTVVGDTIFLGGGTRTSDLEFKAFGASAAETVLGASPLSPASGLFAYRIALATVAPAASPGLPRP
ncbi:MAG: PQQ-binding-like beta-propeller repeat protein [Acidimicrobiales bacterium]